MDLPDTYVQELMEEMESASVLYARAKALAEGLREDRKITKAQLMNVAESEGVAAYSRQEVFAYSHPTYRRIVKDLRQAIEDETLKQYKCKMCELKFEAWRTISANTRAATR